MDDMLQVIQATERPTPQEEIDELLRPLGYMLAATEEAFGKNEAPEEKYESPF